MSGVGTGQIAGSIIIGFLQEEFAFFGATVILGAATLHCFVGTFLLSPVQRHENGPEAGADKVNKKRCHISGNAFLRVFRSSVANLTILKSSRAAILAVGGMFTVNSQLNFISLIPFAIQAAGHSLRAASLCVTVSAVASMVTRCAVSTLTDWPWFSIRVCQMASTTTIVVSTVAFSLVEDVWWQTVFMGLWGCGVGGVMGIFNLTFTHYMGLDNMASTMGTTQLLIGFGAIIIGPTIGLIRDVSGSYVVTMWVLAGLAAGGFVLWVFMPVAVRHDLNKSHNTSLSRQP